LIEERTGAKVKQYGQIFKLNPEVSDIADNYATAHEGVVLISASELTGLLEISIRPNPAFNPFLGF